MKYAFVTFLIISFAGVAVFGFLSMIYGDIHDGGCIASSGMNALCPLNDAFTFVVFHLGAFKYFSTAVLVAVLLTLLSGIVFSLLPRPLDKDEDDNFVFSYNFGKFPILSKNKEITRWLSLHINSPALVTVAV
ncbi:MAG: hypothetical protein HYW79_01490 [Parcubacteria group bacterium]|nr:hypothetical protein [Parcubacteria group bacterium]